MKPATDESMSELGKNWDRVWVGAHLATMAAGAQPYGIVENAAIAVRGDRIAWIGAADTAARAAAQHRIPSHELRGVWITPGLIDCHTHLVYGGNRVAEFERRLERRVLRGNRQGRRRHSVDGARDARGNGRRAARGGAHPGAGVDGRGRHDDRDQVRLRAATRSGAPSARGCEIARARVAGLDRDDLPRPARAARGVPVRAAHFRRFGERSVARGAERRRPRRRGRCVLREHRLQRRRD